MRAIGASGEPRTCSDLGQPGAHRSAGLIGSQINNHDPGVEIVGLKVPLGLRRVVRPVQPIAAHLAPPRRGQARAIVFGRSVPLTSRARTLSPGVGKRRSTPWTPASTMSTEQIASDLYLSKTTVRNHIAHLLAKLGVHTRVQAVVASSRQPGRPNPDALTDRPRGEAGKSLSENRSLLSKLYP